MQQIYADIIDLTPAREHYQLTIKKKLETSFIFNFSEDETNDRKYLIHAKVK